MPESSYFDRADDERRFRGPGGTAGGLGSFALGLVFTVVGAYLVMERAQLVSGYWNWFGQSTFGMTLVPLLVGIGILFFNGRSILGWLVAGLGVMIIMAGILLNLNLYWPRTSVFDFIVMAGLFVGGLGLMARGILAGR